MRYGTEAGHDTSRHRWSGPRKQFELVRERDGETYLIRWWLFDTPLGGICVHRMTAGDARDTVHDHPFGFISVVLRGGGYTERRLNPKTRFIRRHHVDRVNFMRRSDAHYIESLRAPVVWTLLFCGPNRRTWGFWQPVEPMANHVRFGNTTMPDGSIGAWDGRWFWTQHDHFDSGHRA